MFDVDIRDQKRTVVKSVDLGALKAIESRLLWLSTNMIHHANDVRPTESGESVGGHQASCASMVTILTALYFHHLNREDLVSIKPHAAPVYYSIQYLLNQLPAVYMPSLRQFGGLQAYPNRTMPPVSFDYSSGSIGMGAVAPLFSAFTERYVQSHIGPTKEGKSDRRFVAVIGDAELDEGNVWEAILDPELSRLGNALIIVDLNRQSFDRVLSSTKPARLKAMFRENGWNVIEAKYGQKLQEMFEMPGGQQLKQRLERLSHVEFHELLRGPVRKIRPKLVQNDPELEALLSWISDEHLYELITNMGGHDFETLLFALKQADSDPNRPTILFASTIKGYRLPLAGDPENHAKRLTRSQIDDLREALLPPETPEWGKFGGFTSEGRLCQVREMALYKRTQVRDVAPKYFVPTDLPIPATGMISSQTSFGRAITSLSHDRKLAKRLVTMSPDVASVTGLNDWVKRNGVFSVTPQSTNGQDHWRVSEEGKHVELGISEMNFFMMLSMFGLADDLFGEAVIPVGTVYDPFVARGLDSLIYGLYSKSRFIFAGTPSGVTLSYEGGSHQSIITPNLGMSLPNLNYIEPCYAREVMWMFLDAVRSVLDSNHGRASYFRLSKKEVDQTPFEQAQARIGTERLRHQVIAGGYRLRDWRTRPCDRKSHLVHLATTGSMIPEALAAADQLESQGIPVNVINLTHPKRLYETWQANQEACASTKLGVFDWMIPARERYAPLILINDGSSHTHAWLGSAFGTPTTSLGVDQFGQSGQPQELYREMGIDANSIVYAARCALSRNGS